MSKQLSQVIINRFNLQPALLAASHSSLLTDAVQNFITATPKAEAQAQVEAAANLLASYGYQSSAHEKPFVYAEGVAFIPVTGLLLNKFSASYGWATGYNFIRSQMNAALDDDDVKLIVFDCHSGGGEVAGCFELANDIRESRSKKPSLAVIDSASYSACYAIASSATRVSAIPSGGVGSIGALVMHIDISKMLTDAGIKVTFIYSGDHKVDGNMYEPLPKAVKTSIQARVDSARQEFVSLVATNRGLDTKVVYDTEAACYSAAEAMELGLIDAIAKPLEAVQAFIIELSRSEPEMETPMSTVAKTGEESTASATQTAPTTAAAAPAATVDVGAERMAERARIAGITGHENAKDRAVLANHLALNTNLSVDEAVAVLAASATEKKAEAPKADAFAQAMDTSANPNVGADVTAGAEQSVADRINANYSLATGFKH
jgi:signal peptide peptidase SppA